uniref:Small ribosomal subunit protein uS9m n=1 Tax=Panthera leo TaxID=9689 RepID=A0A8C9DAB4_PANLE
MRAGCARSRVPEEPARGAALGQGRKGGLKNHMEVVPRLRQRQNSTAAVGERDQEASFGKRPILLWLLRTRGYYELATPGGGAGHAPRGGSHTQSATSRPAPRGTPPPPSLHPRDPPSPTGACAAVRPRPFTLQPWSPAAKMAAPSVFWGAAVSYRLFLGGRVSLALRQGVWKAAAAELQRAIAYLFPSGLFEKQARPIMKHPEQIFPKQRAIQWGEDGRPFHFLFYTGKQSYYSLMHEAYGKLLDVEKRQNQLQAKGLFSEKTKTKDLIGSRWLIKEELEEMLVEKLSDQDYAQFIRLLERLLTVECSAEEEEFVQRFRRSVTVQSRKQLIEPLQYDGQGMAFSTSEGKRKSAKAEAIVYEHGSGRIKVNGIDYLLYFPVTQDREQLMFPFHFLDRLGKHDVTCTVSGGGRSSQAGAIRLAMAKALCSFVTEEEVEWMRQAGLLTADPRVRERKKPGQEGARRKFTWKKR